MIYVLDRTCDFVSRSRMADNFIRFANMLIDKGYPINSGDIRARLYNRLYKYVMYNNELHDHYVDIIGNCFCGVNKRYVNNNKYLENVIIVKYDENGLDTIDCSVENKVNKDLAVGEGYMRVSVERPNYNVAGLALNPIEKPFAADNPVRSISIDYPKRLPGISSTNWLWDWILKNWWWIYFFVISMVFALVFKPFFNVKI